METPHASIRTNDATTPRTADPRTADPRTADPRTAGLRATDHDRNATIERLGDALAEGALDTTEYNHRLERAATATTLGQLHPLTADLPVSRAARARADAARKAAEDRAAQREWANEWGYWTGGAVIMTAIWAINALREGEWGFYWPLVPLGIWAAILLSYAIWPERHDD